MLGLPPFLLRNMNWRLGVVARNSRYRPSAGKWTDLKADRIIAADTPAWVAFLAGVTETMHSCPIMHISLFIHTAAPPLDLLTTLGGPAQGTLSLMLR
jgi:hypothetical protein